MVSLSSHQLSKEGSGLHGVRGKQVRKLDVSCTREGGVCPSLGPMVAQKAGDSAGVATLGKRDGGS